MSDLPERIGHYRVESTLGRGGMGEVFLAWDERLHRRVALKRLRPDVADSEASRERFRREASTAAELSHPGAVHVYDLVEDNGADYLVMEYVPGTSLAQRLASGPLSIAETLRFGRQIAEGLAAAHAAGLVHRDLKADNVILTEKGDAKILDFGLARHVVRLPDETALTQRGFVVGTYHAMSPEQATGGEVDERSDLFSFGSLLAEMLTGRPPFKADTPAATLKRVLTEEPPPVATLRRDVPEGLSVLISRLLAKEPAARPASAELVARTLRDIAVNHHGDSRGLAETISEMPTSMAPRGRVRPVWWRRWWIATAIGAVAVVGAALWWPQAPLRVLVAPPKLEPADHPGLQLAGQSALLAALNALTSLQGIEPLAPSLLIGEAGDVKSMATELAAKEVLAISLTAAGPGMAQIAVSRMRDDGKVRSPVSRAYTLSVEPGDLLSFADKVSGHIRSLYPDHEPREGLRRGLAPQVPAEDYATFLGVSEQLDSGKEIDHDHLLAALSQALEHSPGFFEAQLLAANIHLSRFPSSKDRTDLDLARKLIERAKEIVPNDPQLLRLQVKLALETNELRSAEEVLQRLQGLLPGDTELLPLRAEVAEEQGDPKEAAKLLSIAVRRAPSWRNYYLLAQLEFRIGRAEDARFHLAEARQRWPANKWVDQASAQGELLYGEAHRAEALYRKLVEGSKQGDAGNYTNLGLSLYLQRKNPAAIEAYRKALAIETDNPDIILNLAEAEHEAGLAQEATASYERACRQLNSNEDVAAAGRIALAQCLARLGEYSEAVEIARDAVQKSPDDPFVSYTASLVHVLAGEHPSAVLNAVEALQSGLAEHWFTIPALSAVYDDPRFKKALQVQQHRGAP